MSFTKSQISSLALGALLLVGPYVLTQSWHRQTAHAQTQSPRLIAPMTLYYTEVLTEKHASDGEFKTMPVMEEVVAYRSNGDRAQLTTIKSTRMPDMTMRSLKFIDGTRILLRDGVKAKSTMKYPADTIVEDYNHLQLDPSTGCFANFAGMSALNTKLVGKGPIINGHPTYEIVGDVGDAVRMFRDPTLACTLVRQVVDFAGTNGDYRHDELTLTKVTMGEPDASLFDTGDGYQEVPPSKASQMVLGQSEQHSGHSGQKALDDRYWKFKKH